MKSQVIPFCLFFVLFCTSTSRGADLDTPEKVNAAITRKNSYEAAGLGGRYGFMEKILAKTGILGNSLFPPKSVYAFAKDKHVKSLSTEDMPAICFERFYLLHLDTTNVNPRKGSIDDNYRNVLFKGQDLFKTGKYFEGINKTIQFYFENPDKIGKGRDPTDAALKQGIKDALEIHVKNQLITAAQKAELIKLHQLDVDDKSSTLKSILHTPLRDGARTLILADIAKYPGVKIN